MQILLANPRGFCAGVDRAVDIVNRALELLGAPVYVRHEVVHNRFVVDDLRSRGAIFTDDISDIPAGATIIFSAHGVSQAVREAAKARALHVFDATCPLVTKVHMEVARYSRNAQECILIGHKGHPEVEGTMGQYYNPEGGIYLVEDKSSVDKLVVKNPDRLFYVTQTTLSIDDTTTIIAALRQKFPHIQGPKREDICYATQNRQEAVRRLAEKSDLVIVVGSMTSSNSNRLKELSASLGRLTHMIDDADQLKTSWFKNINTVGITASASTPEILVQQVIAKLQTIVGETTITELSGTQENILFALPKELRKNTKHKSSNSPPLESLEESLKKKVFDKFCS
jgi:4-hydroxy-3-methylbut-2-enyl diphosphate reductase